MNGDERACIHITNVVENRTGVFRNDAEFDEILRQTFIREGEFEIRLYFRIDLFASANFVEIRVWTDKGDLSGFCLRENIRRIRLDITRDGRLSIVCLDLDGDRLFDREEFIRLLSRIFDRWGKEECEIDDDIAIRGTRRREKATV